MKRLKNIEEVLKLYIVFLMEMNEHGERKKDWGFYIFNCWGAPIAGPFGGLYKAYKEYELIKEKTQSEVKNLPKIKFPRNKYFSLLIFPQQGLVLERYFSDENGNLVNYDSAPQMKCDSDLEITR